MSFTRSVPRSANSRVVGRSPHSTACAALSLPHDLGGSITGKDIEYIQQAAAVSLECEGLTHPHPNHGAVLVSSAGQVAGSAFHRAQGTPSVEEQVLRDAGPAAQGGTLYLNLETGDCHGDTTGLEWIIRSGVSRVVMGSRHPLQHIRGTALSFLRSTGVDVQLLEAHADAMQKGTDAHGALCACLDANEALLHRAVLGVPMSTLKYAMTMDGKIATPTGHAAWVSNSQSRQRVFAQRAVADAVIVGGNTVRRDNPRLTTRRDGGHRPIRVVMSRTLDLPEDRHLWDVTIAPTILMTQQGVRSDMQARLRDRGVEVVEFDFLTPTAVAQYCASRGFLRCFWECGGTLSAPALASGTIHRVMAFIAPKIIGGTQSYTPVGNLGFVEMTQAVQILDPKYDIIDGDILATGSLPSSGGALALHSRLLELREPAEHLVSLPHLYSSSAAAAASQTAAKETFGNATATQNGASANGTSVSGATSSGAVCGAASDQASEGSGDSQSSGLGEEAAATESAAEARHRRGAKGIVEFYKAWDRWGALSNFSPHAIDMPRGQTGLEGGTGGAATEKLACRWASVEHYYQAQKFSHAASDVSSEVASRAEDVIDAILSAPSPEEAARIGRFDERMHPELMRADWAEAKVRVMRLALRQKFSQHAGPRTLLLSTAEWGKGSSEADGGLELVEKSPHDLFWGCGRDGSGQNMLGKLLQETRAALLAELSPSSATHAAEAPLQQLV